MALVRALSQRIMQTLPSDTTLGVDFHTLHNAAKDLDRFATQADSAPARWGYQLLGGVFEFGRNICTSFQDTQRDLDCLVRQSDSLVAKTLFGMLGAGFGFGSFASELPNDVAFGAVDFASDPLEMISNLPSAIENNSTAIVGGGLMMADGRWSEGTASVTRGVVGDYFILEGGRLGARAVPKLYGAYELGIQKMSAAALRARASSADFGDPLTEAIYQHPCAAELGVAEFPVARARTPKQTGATIIRGGYLWSRPDSIHYVVNAQDVSRSWTVEFWDRTTPGLQDLPQHFWAVSRHRFEKFAPKDSHIATVSFDAATQKVTVTRHGDTPVLISSNRIPYANLSEGARQIPLEHAPGELTVHIANRPVQFTFNEATAGILEGDIVIYDPMTVVTPLPPDQASGLYDIAYYDVWGVTSTPVHEHYLLDVTDGTAILLSKDTPAGMMTQHTFLTNPALIAKLERTIRGDPPPDWKTPNGFIPGHPIIHAREIPRACWEAVSDAMTVVEEARRALATHTSVLDDAIKTLLPTQSAPR